MFLEILQYLGFKVTADRAYREDDVRKLAQLGMSIQFIQETTRLSYKQIEEILSVK